MHDLSLETTLLGLIFIYLISSILQKKLRIPLPYSLIILSYLSNIYFHGIINLGEHFDKMVTFLIPFILMFDAIHLKWKDIKKYKYSIIYLSVFSVAISIIIGVALNYFSIFGVGLSIGAYIALFSMNMATDAISVSAIFSQFKSIPHNIKVLVEAESLGNDATAMIAFYFVALPWIINGSFDINTIPMIALKVYGLSILIGLFIGFFAINITKYFNLIKEEILVAVSVAFVSFTYAESVHLSGILTLIVAVITYNTMIEKLISVNKLEEKDIKNKSKIVKYFKASSSNEATQKTVKHTLEVFAFISATIIFSLFATLINIDNLWIYRYEIITMYAATTLIRMLVMYKFAILGKATKAIDYVGINGWVILTLAGIKGSLSIIMLHALPANFEYYEMFESITIGVILLSTFTYGTLLLIYMSLNDSSRK